MADALISPEVGLSFGFASICIIAYCSKKLKNELTNNLIPLMGVLGAFIFAGQMINFNIPGTGSSGHIGGGLLLAIMLGPYAGFITISSVLFIQALFFADGGLLSLGCNIWNLGIYPCFIAYPLIYKTILNNNSNNKKLFFVSIIGSIIGLELGAFSVIMQTVLSGITDLPFKTFTYMMIPIHLVISIVEGVITATILIYVKNIQPDIIINTFKNNKNTLNYKKLLLTFGILAIVAGGIFSKFASSNPDGLEWSITKVTGIEELTGKESAFHKFFSKLQNKTAILPDYDFKKTETITKISTDSSVGTSMSGIIGGLLTLGIIIIISIVLKFVKSKKASQIKHKDTEKNK